MRSLLLVLGCATLTLQAEPVPHATRAGRLVETRDGFSVEYSPGQEAWMEMGFEQMRAAAAAAQEAPAPPPPDATVIPGSVRDLHARRDAFLAAIAHQIGLPAPVPVMGRTFDTFIGYYDMLDEVMQIGAGIKPETFLIRDLAIWQRDDLLDRLRAGEVIEGMTYDAATDKGNYSFNHRTSSGPSARSAAIREAMEAQQLKHTFNYDKGTVSATVTPGQRPEIPAKKPETEPAPTQTAPAKLVLPVFYRGDLATEPTADAFSSLATMVTAFTRGFAEQARRYRDPAVVSIILHETAEVGLMEKIIGSADRRWLCDGTANYVAWRVTRDLVAADFATQVYNLDAQLRLHTAQQPKIDLIRWSAVEKQSQEERRTELDNAHYPFATRAMFMLTQRHGEDALATVWQDVAKTNYRKTSAKTFADAYLKRYKANLADLVKAAEKTPLPAPSAEKP